MEEAFDGLFAGDVCLFFWSLVKLSCSRSAILRHIYIHVLSLGCFWARKILEYTFFSLFLPQVCVQNLDSWGRDHLAYGINLRLTRLRKHPQSIADFIPRHDEHHPNPAIERAGHLVGDDRARAHDPAKDGGQGPPSNVDARAEGRGQRARHVVDEPAAGDVRHRLDESCAGSGEHRARVERRRRQQRPAERRAGVPRTRRGVGRAGARDGCAHEGEAVRVEAC